MAGRLVEKSARGPQHLSIFIAAGRCPVRQAYLTAPTSNLRTTTFDMQRSLARRSLTVAIMVLAFAGAAGLVCGHER
jgi:hypothetical protein